MKNKITIIADNKAEKPLVSEHGFSVLLETGGKRILFDTGQGDTLFQNAELLGILLNNLDILVLSHGHYDHGGNLKKIIDLNPSIEFYAHPDCLISRYSFHNDDGIESVSLTKENSSALLNLPEKQIHWCRNKTEIIPGVWLTGTISRNNEFEDTGGAFFIDKKRENPDLLMDDLSLCIEGDKGITVICGCCHSGLQNTIEQILTCNKASSIHTIIGGLHLVNASTSRLDRTITYINKIGIKKIIGAHCTGKVAMNRFKKELNSEVLIGSAGLSLKNF